MARCAGPVGLVPVADREQGLDLVCDEHGIVDPVTAHGFQRCRCQACRLPGPAQHGQHVSERDIGPLESHGITAFAREPHGLREPSEALVTAAEVGEVAAEHGERPQLGWACPDRSREHERLLADRE